MANAWIQVDQIAAEALMHLEDALIITQLTARDKTSEFNHTPSGYAVGDTVRIKTRPDYIANEFSSTISVQSIRESQRSMVVEKHYDVSVEITAKEKALDFESFAEQVVKPAAYRLAEKCDQYVGTKFSESTGLYTSDDLFVSAADMALAREAALLQSLEPDGRYCLVNTTLEAKLLGATYFNQHQTRGGTGEDILNSGELARTMGLTFFTSINYPTITVNTPGTMICVTDNGAGGNTNNQIGASILTVDTQTATKTLAVGDRIVIAGVRRPLISNATEADTSAVTSIALVDPITEIIPDDAAVTIYSSGNAAHAVNGTIFDSQSLAVAMPVLDKPSDKPSQVISSNGYSIRVVSGYDMSTKKETMSLDLLIGAKAYDPRRMTNLGEY